MSGTRDFRVLEEIVSSHQNDWESDNGLIFVCRNIENEVDVLGNTPLRPYLGEGRRLFDFEFCNWINAVNAACEVKAIGASEPRTLAWLIDTSIRERMSIPLRRVVRIGDCRLKYSFGTLDELHHAEEIVDKNCTDGQQIVLIDVAGADAVFLYANFKWESDDPSPLKSCRPFDDICDLTQLLLGCREIDQILVTDHSLYSRLRTRIGGPHESKILVFNEEKEDEFNVAQKVISDYFSKNKFISSSSSAPKMRWLDRMRNTLFSASSTAKNSIDLDDTTKLTELLFRAINETNDSELRVILKNLEGQKHSTDTRNERLKIGISCLVCSKLNIPLNDVQTTILMDCSSETELWWSEAILAEATSWAHRRGKGEWLTKLNDRGLEAISKTVILSDEIYLHIRNEILEFRPDKLDEVTPFQTLEQHNKVFENLASAKDSLHKAITAQRKIDAHNKKEKNNKITTKNDFMMSMSMAGYEATRDVSIICFYDSMGVLIHNFLDKKVIELSNIARNALGDSKYQRELELKIEHLSGNTDVSKQLAAEFCALFPEEEIGWRIYAADSFNLGNYDEAIKSLERAALLSPDDQEIYRDISNCQSRNGSTANAILTLESIAEGQRETETTLMLARLYYLDDQAKHSMKLFETIQPSDMDQHSLILFTMACIDTNEWFTAMSTMNEQRQIFSDYLPKVVSYAAAMLSADDEASKAVSWLLPELGHSKEWNIAAINLSDCLDHLGRVDDALNTLENLIEPCEDVIESCVCILLQNNRIERAHEVAVENLALFPKSLYIPLTLGEVSRFLGRDRPDLFHRVIAAIDGIPHEDRSDYQILSLASAYTNLGNISASDFLLNSVSSPDYHILLQSALNAAVDLDFARADLLYKKAYSLMSQSKGLERSSAIRHHISRLRIIGVCKNLPNLNDLLIEVSGLFSAYIERTQKDSVAS